MPVKVKVRRGGYFRKPKLDNGPLTIIGNIMVKEQLKRWAAATDANGAPAKPLGKKYFFIKQAYTKQNRPKRDNKMTGALIRNFTLRKAIDNQIRAEPTQRLTRQHAMRSQGYAEMIGFAGSDTLAVTRATQVQYGSLVKRLWVVH